MSTERDHALDHVAGVERDHALDHVAGVERDHALDHVAGVERDHALDRAVQALARRDHSTASLRAKLDRAGISAEARDNAVERLALAGYLDDARFARDRAAHLAERGYGDDWIGADLDANGVPAEAAGEALAELEPERERALRRATELGGGLRAVRVLRRRGFTDESLEPLLDAPLHTTPQEE